MMDEDEDLLEAVEASDDADDEKSHAKLLDAISGLDGKKIKKRTQRTVPTNQVSEFNFTAPTDDAKVQLHELMGTLKTSTKHGSLKSKLNRVQNQRVVPVPLPRHQKEKIEREVAYSKTTQDISKWDSIVRSNRQAEQLQFPLQKSEVHLLNTTGKFKNFKPRTPLELEVAAVLNGNRDDLPTKKKELTPAEERALAAMSLEEARERRAELQKFRALMSYKEAKAKRQKRIKSKKYHRVLKKEKLKHEKKALEELEKNDPEGYQEKLEEVERQRIEERMSLKHRGGSKYSKKQILYAKYDDQARQRVQDMLQKSRQLTQKTVAVSDSEGEEENEELDSEEEMMERQISSMSSNPWMKVQAPAPTRSEFSRPEVVLNSEGKDEEEESEDVSDEDEDVLMKMGKELQKRQGKMEVAVHRSEEQLAESRGKLEDPEKKEQIVFDHSEIGKNRSSKNLKKQKKNKKKELKNIKENIDEIFQTLEEKVEDEGKKDNTEIRKKKKPRRKKKTVTEEKEVEEMDDTPLISEGLRRKKTLEEIEEDGEDSGEEVSHSAKSSRKSSTKRDSKKTDTLFNGNSPESKEEVFVDPKKLFTLETKISDIANPDITGQNMEEESDEEEGQRSIIAQAFADDDVIDEFVKEKNSVIDRDKPSDLDLFLPGWGCWGGEGVKVSQKKRKRFVIKAPEGPPRKDSRLGNVIISEKKDKAISKHQVSELPFPYVSVDQYEQSIRAPVGKNWNPETAVKELVKPKIITKLGSIIQPISKADVFKNDSKKRGADMSVQDQTVGSRKHKKRKK